MTVHVPQPCRGAIARCGLGTLGIIISDERQLVTYPDGTTSEAYVGIHLTYALAPVGSQWSSINPTVLAVVDEKITAAIVAQVAMRVE